VSRLREAVREAQARALERLKGPPIRRPMRLNRTIGTEYGGRRENKLGADNACGSRESLAGSEQSAAAALARLAASDPEIERSRDVHLEIFPSVQCFGQRVQDIDLVVIYRDSRPPAKYLHSSDGRAVQSFCVAIEVKDHPPKVSDLLAIPAMSPTGERSTMSPAKAKVRSTPSATTSLRTHQVRGRPSS